MNLKDIMLNEITQAGKTNTIWYHLHVDFEKQNLQKAE
jgi:hypothetical protein